MFLLFLLLSFFWLTCPPQRIYYWKIWKFKWNLYWLNGDENETRNENRKYKIKHSKWNHDIFIEFSFAWVSPSYKISFFFLSSMFHPFYFVDVLIWRLGAFNCSCPSIGSKYTSWEYRRALFWLKQAILWWLVLLVCQFHSQTLLT